MVRCEQETVCDPSGLRYKDPPKSDGRESRESKETPEIITTIAAASGVENGSPGNTPPPSPQVSFSQEMNLNSEGKTALIFFSLSSIFASTGSELI